MSFYLITGGAGFIGSNLSHTLLKAGHKVRIIDNFLTGRRENLEDIINDVQLIEGDIKNLNSMQKAADKVDYILHQAALSSVPRSVADPISSNQNNIDGTLNVLTAARDNNVKRVVLASSSSVYGDSIISPKIETTPRNPLSPYAITKYVSELYAKVFYSLYDLETVCLRYFNVFGPRQDPDSYYSAVIPKFIKSMLKGEAPTIYGDGEQSRDFTYIDNAVEANILASISLKAGHGEVVNIACGERRSLNQLVDSINSILLKDIKPIYGDARKGDVKHSLADIELAKELLGYEVKVTFEEGLKKTIINGI